MVHGEFPVLAALRLLVVQHNRSEFPARFGTVLAASSPILDIRRGRPHRIRIEVSSLWRIV